MRCLTAYISGTENLRRLKFGAFLYVSVQQIAPKTSPPIDLPMGRAPPRNREKSKFSKIKSSLARSGVRCCTDLVDFEPLHQLINHSLSNFGPRSLRSCSGVPNLENTCNIKALAATGVVWFRMEIASAHFGKWPITVTIC